MKYILISTLLITIHLIPMLLFGSLVRPNNKVIITITGKDFENTNYTSSTDCALAKAIKRYCSKNNIPINVLIVGPYGVLFNDVEYPVEYDPNEFYSDKFESGFYPPNHSIRNISLLHLTK